MGPLTFSVAPAYGTKEDGTPSSGLMDAFTSLIKAVPAVTKGIADIKAASKGDTVVSPSYQATAAANPNLTAKLDANPVVKYALIGVGALLVIGLIVVVVKK